MGIPVSHAFRIGAYVLRQHVSGRERYPLVLMLEPLFRCNLACAGCGKIDYPDEILNQRLSVDACMKAIDECGAPVVSIAGGEPLLHRDMPEIVRGFLARRKIVILCTNALLLAKKIDQYRPHPDFNWSIHLDGDKEMHDKSVCQRPTRNIFSTAQRPSSCFAESCRAGAAEKAGRLRNRLCSSIFSLEIKPTAARLGAIPRARCSVGSVPAISWARAMPRLSRS